MQKFEIILKRSTTATNSDDHNDYFLLTWSEHEKLMQDNNKKLSKHVEITFSLLEICVKSMAMNHKACHQDTIFLRIFNLRADRA